jgi:hypothetical protein
MSYCVLLLFLTCRPARPLQMTLASAQAAGFLADSIQTREITIMHQFIPWPGPAEHDPITRPFVGAEPTGPRLLAFGIVAVTATSIVSDRMRRSHTWVRHIWWLPQVGSRAGLAVSVKIDWKLVPLWPTTPSASLGTGQTQP